MAKLIIKKINILDKPTSYLDWLCWPEGISYEAWRNCLKRIYAMRSKKLLKKQKRTKKQRAKRRKIIENARIRWKRRKRKRKMQAILLEMLRERQLYKKHVLEQHKPEQPVYQQQENQKQYIKIELIAMLKIFLEKKHIPKLIEQIIPDYRNSRGTTYSKQTIMLSALCIFLFRMASGNKYDQRSHDEDEKYSKINVAKLINSTEEQVPAIRTIEDFLKSLDEDRINDLMIAFFKETWIIDGETKEIYRGEWLVSWKISMENCRSTAAQGRLRWQEEDLFNSLKNRGFSLKHDYSRSPSSCMNWQKLTFFAFGIFELFRLTDTVQARLPGCSNIAIAEKLLGQLLHRPTEEIFREQIKPERIQFRYTFKITVDLAARFYRAMAPPDKK